MRVRPKTRKATLRRCAPDAPTAGRFKIERMRALFPSYDRSRPNLLPTEGLLRLAKMKAVVIMSERAEIAEGIFRAHAVRHYRVKPHQVTFDQRCLRRIRNARLSMTISSELVGETALDEEGQIWISGYSAMSTLADASSSKEKSGVLPNSVRLARRGTPGRASEKAWYWSREVTASTKRASAPAST